MRIVEPSATIEGQYDYDHMLAHVEKAGRTCYKSEDRITAGSAAKLIKHVIARGHESVLEHMNISVRFICDRGVSHELVRHRIASFSQESTRYCNYVGDTITFINPLLEEGTEAYSVWHLAMENAEYDYNRLIRAGCKPQIARSVLPNSLKTELVMTANIREWRLFFHLRCDKAAHPQMRQLTIPLYEEMCTRFPAFFVGVEFNK